MIDSMSCFEDFFDAFDFLPSLDEVVSLLICAGTLTADKKMKLPITLIRRNTARYLIG
jgi:hypothetical protein